MTAVPRELNARTQWLLVDLPMLRRVAAGLRVFDPGAECPGDNSGNAPEHGRPVLDLRHGHPCFQPAVAMDYEQEGGP